jgi:hypothetical protein
MVRFLPVYCYIRRRYPALLTRLLLSRLVLAYYCCLLLVGLLQLFSASDVLGHVEYDDLRPAVWALMETYQTYHQPEHRHSKLRVFHNAARFQFQDTCTDRVTFAILASNNRRYTVRVHSSPDIKPNVLLFEWYVMLIVWLFCFSLLLHVVLCVPNSHCLPKTLCAGFEKLHPQAQLLKIDQLK